MNIDDIYLRFDRDGHQALVSVGELVRRGVPKNPVTRAFLRLETEEALDSNGNPLHLSVIPECDDDHHAMMNGPRIAQSLLGADRKRQPAHSVQVASPPPAKLSPFEEELERNLEAAIEQLQLGAPGEPEHVRAGTLVQSVRVPYMTDGEPVGANKAWQYYQMIRAAVLRNPQWNIVVTPVLE